MEIAFFFRTGTLLFCLILASYIWDLLDSYGGYSQFFCTWLPARRFVEILFSDRMGWIWMPWSLECAVVGKDRSTSCVFGCKEPVFGKDRSAGQGYQTWWDWGIALLHDWSFMPSAQAKLVFLFWKDILHNLKAQYIYGAKHAPIKIQECTLHSTLSRMHICFSREKARILELLPVLLALQASHLVCVPVDFDDRTLHPFWFLWTRQQLVPMTRVMARFMPCPAAGCTANKSP